MATVMFAEDDKAVREVSTRILVRGGHKVEPYSDGKAAMLRVKKELSIPKDKRTLEFVMLDGNMGEGPHGSEVARKALDLKIPILLASGDLSISEYDQDYKLLESQGVGFLRKPFEFTNLISAFNYGLKHKTFSGSEFCYSSHKVM